MSSLEGVGIEVFQRCPHLRGSTVSEGVLISGISSNNFFPSILGDASPPVFSCGSGSTVDVTQLCDGVADCGGLLPADDETAVICDSKLHREMYC